MSDTPRTDEVIRSGLTLFLADHARQLERLLRRIRQWDMLEHAADGRFWTHDIDAVLNAAPQLSTARLAAEPSTAEPSKEGLGQGDAAVAAPDFLKKAMELAYAHREVHRTGLLVNEQMSEETKLGNLWKNAWCRAWPDYERAIAVRERCCEDVVKWNAAPQDKPMECSTSLKAPAVAAPEARGPIDDEFDRLHQQLSEARTTLDHIETLYEMETKH